MAGSFAKSLRQFERLPVFIEEDHNDVVPFIHRAIASRHLPMSGIPMVHFDSHPDLLLPLHMQADDVFDKEKLYSGLSIENWILPLIYAGHISEVFWLKPPWADQLQDVSDLIFYVGKWKVTGEIRTTLDDPYFLTEALYAPESQLTNIKRATLHVITIMPSSWSSEFDSNSSCNHGYTSEKISNSPANTAQGTSNSGETHGDSYTSGSAQGGDESQVHHSPEDNDFGKHSSIANTDDQELHANLGPSETKLRKVDDKSINENEKCVNPAESREESWQTNMTDTIVENKSTGDSGSIAACSQETRNETRSTQGTSDSQELLNQKCLRALQSKLKGHPFMLDVDLDFFSVKDPFQQDCCPELSVLLRELFEFKLPKDKSEENVIAFSQARQAQLDELEVVFQRLQHEPDSSSNIQDPHRQQIVDKLVTLLSSDEFSGIPIDFEMLYRAGCTFDGTPLPHHVSSSKQIQQLMSASGSVLKSLPTPTLVTVARSSIDDYCPQDQVESIQESMLEVFSDIYKDLDVNKAYEEQ